MSQGNDKGMGDIADSSELPVLQNPVATKPLPSMTHTECVEYAARYLSQRCPVVLPEFFSWNGELADVIGFKNDFSTLIECKVSRGDFLKDKHKPFRANPEKGMGDRRYYCCPKGLIKPEELPEGWGLLYIYPSGLVREVKASYIPDPDPLNADSWKYNGCFKKNKEAEFHLLYYYARRANYAGVHKTIVEYRGFDK